MDTRIFHLHALSALHVGVGQAVGVVDLPIMRARASNLPIVPGSAIKGVLRDEFADQAVIQKRLFGPESNVDNPHAGAIALGDAHLLVLPVRSLAGVTAFVTCPFVLARYAADRKRANPNGPIPDPVTIDAEACLVGTSSVCKASATKVILEDLDLAALPGADEWAQAIAGQVHSDSEWQKLFAEHFVIVADDVFSFLADTATEVRARIRINSSGVVERGALWYEENLPAESVLWGIAAFGPARDGSEKDKTSVGNEFLAGIGAEKAIQIGGKATVGRGLVRFRIQGTSS
jgi:CRISPR-associated protein Cmr4